MPWRTQRSWSPPRGMVGLGECHGWNSVNCSWLTQHMECGPETSSESRSPVWGGWLRWKQLYWESPVLSSFQPLADLPKPAAASVHSATLASFPFPQFVECPLQSGHFFSLRSILHQGANYASSGEGFSSVCSKPLLASLDAPIPWTGRTINLYQKMMLETSITPALSLLCFSAPEGDANLLHLTINAHIPGKTEQAGELRTFVQGLNKPF